LAKLAANRFPAGVSSELPRVATSGCQYNQTVGVVDSGKEPSPNDSV
jgi:hypothetical protein